MTDTEDTSKYETYAALAEAFASGELSANEWELCLDNDHCELRWIGTGPADDDFPDDAHAFWVKKSNEGRSMFRGYGYCYYDGFRNCVRLLGIPCNLA